MLKIFLLHEWNKLYEKLFGGFEDLNNKIVIVKKKKFLNILKQKKVIQKKMVL